MCDVCKAAAEAVQKERGFVLIPVLQDGDVTLEKVPLREEEQEEPAPPLFLPYFEEVELAPVLEITEEERRHLPQAVYQAAWNCARLHRSKERHEQRVTVARKAAIHAARYILCPTLPPWTSDTSSSSPVQQPTFSVTYVVALFLLYLEKLGVGGKGNLEGESTDRPHWACALGAGRKQANDGAAWTAALGAAAIDLANELNATWLGDPRRIEVYHHFFSENEWDRLRTVLGNRYSFVLATRIVLGLCECDTPENTRLEESGLVFLGDMEGWGPVLVQLSNGIEGYAGPWR